MRRIDKTPAAMLSTKYRDWLHKLESDNREHDKRYRYYYDDIIMNLYRCQSGVCAYTEMRICVPELYAEGSWHKGRHAISNGADYNRLDHFGEMDHFDANDKERRYWNWHNLFMIHAKVNSIKTNHQVVDFLKPDLPAYDPAKYFDYDDETHRFVPNTDIEDPEITRQIQHMIDKVLCLNHGVVKNDRRDYINSLKDRKKEKSILLLIGFLPQQDGC